MRSANGRPTVKRTESRRCLLTWLGPGTDTWALHRGSGQVAGSPEEDGRMSELETAAELPEDDAPTFESALPQGRQRFLAHVIEHALAVGRRTHEDFIHHFPPTAIMEGLKDQSQLRANILVITTGVKTKIARKKSWDSAGQDLQIALDEGEADAETIVTLFEPDDRVRFLDAQKLWAYVVEGEFWRAKTGAEFDIAKAHTAFMLDRALKDELIEHKDVVDGITVSKLAEHLPRIELEKIITAALRQSEKEKPFHETDLLRETPTTTLVEHVPLPHIWETVIEPRIARTHDFLENEDAPASATSVDTSSVSPASDFEDEDKDEDEPDDELGDSEDVQEELDDEVELGGDDSSKKAAAAPPAASSPFGAPPKPAAGLGLGKASDGKVPSPAMGVFGGPRPAKGGPGKGGSSAPANGQSADNKD